LLVRVDYLADGATITAKQYVALLDELKQQLVFKRRGRLSKGILFLQDSAAPQKEAIMNRKLADLHFEVLQYQAYSPDLTTSDYYSFPTLRERKFSTIEKATSAAGG
jgi:hypothetical protein